jgi:regulatory protein
MDIDDAELDELRAASVYSLCLAHAMRLIGSQALSKKGLTDKLRQKGEDAENAQRAVDYLEQMGLLDDAAYAGIVVRHYAAKGLGAGRIRSELSRHGVPKDLWDDALKEMPAQDDKMDKFIRSRLTDPSDSAQIKKVTEGLVRRGYSWGDIKEALERFKAEAEDDGWSEQ